MISKNENPAVNTLLELVEIARGIHSDENAWLFALTWLAAYRLTPVDAEFGNAPTFKLLSKKTWDLPCYDEIPLEAKQLVWGADSVSSSQSAIQMKALSAIVRLQDNFESLHWDVIDAPWQLSGTGLAGIFGDSALAPELCDLMFEPFTRINDNTIWIPFDATGQLVLRAVRKGMRVIAAGPGRRSDLHLRLLLAIEGPNQSSVLRVSFDAPLDGDKRDVAADFLIAIPPFGMRIQAGTGWRQWEGLDESQYGPNSLYEHRSETTHLRLDRSDSWAVAAFWPRIAKQAVFLVSPNVLFAKGQEQKLREYLVLKSNALAVVTSLPNRQFSSSTMSCALLVMNRRRIGQSVSFIDASDMTVDSKSSMKFSRIMDRARISALVVGDIEDSKVEVTATIAEIAEQDFNLVPARYLRPTFSAYGGTRKKLGELVTIVRAPAASKDTSATTVDEAGIPDMDRWNRISGPFLKAIDINPRKMDDSILRPNDVLLSIKGTLGKTALIGQVPIVEPYFRNLATKIQEDSAFSMSERVPAVPSQSCVALRVRDDLIRPIFLFLYLRSDEFKQQIEALRVGTSVAHVTPSTLLQEIHIPVPTLEEQDAYEQRYFELCRLEAAIDEAKQRIDEIRGTLWPIESGDMDIQ